MKIVLLRLELVTRQTTEEVGFTPITFLHGPIGSGKSTVARLVDFCFGGDLVETPAIQKEFVSARLFANIGAHDVVLERDKNSSAVRVSWQLTCDRAGQQGPSATDIADSAPNAGTPESTANDGRIPAGGAVGSGDADNATPEQSESIGEKGSSVPEEPGPVGDAATPSSDEPKPKDASPSSPRSESVLAPIEARGAPIVEGWDDVENLSDLIFRLSGVDPIRVRKSKRDPDSKLVRLSFRDLLFYCYLTQDELDSSFFSSDHPFKRQKSIDAMRFVFGFHSERLNDLEQRLYRALDDQRTRRATAEQLEKILKDLDFDSELQIVGHLDKIGEARSGLRKELAELEASRKVATHPLDHLRARLRELNARLSTEENSLAALRDKLAKRESLKAELLSAKVKALRTEAAQRVLGQVEFQQCPQCETPLGAGRREDGHCLLCGQVPERPLAYEDLASEFDERADELRDLISRHKREVSSQEKRLDSLRTEKSRLDEQLNDEAALYDAPFVARLRELERGIAEIGEREKHLRQLRRIPARLERLTREAAELQGEIDVVRKGVEEENRRFKNAQNFVEELSTNFKQLLLRVRFPGVSQTDEVVVDTHTWQPRVLSGELEWGYAEAGSGGKKVLFKVLYALALHELAAQRGLPLPTFLIVDSPTKNISHDVNPELFKAFYQEVYRVAQVHRSARQFILIDSALVRPAEGLDDIFSERLLDHSDEAPPLISYYRGP